jgi:hypothetical protein
MMMLFRACIFLLFIHQVYSQSGSSFESRLRIDQLFGQSLSNGAGSNIVNLDDQGTFYVSFRVSKTL